MDLDLCLVGQGAWVDQTHGPCAPPCMLQPGVSPRKLQKAHQLLRLQSMHIFMHRPCVSLAHGLHVELQAVKAGRLFAAQLCVAAHACTRSC